ncbi:protease [Archangium violaceum]|nr:protease [Archangium violaceum]
MIRGHVGWVALCCLALGGNACTPRNTTPEQKPAPEQKENPAVATTLECSLSVPPTLKAGQPVEARFQLTNRTAQPLFVLKWRTPLEGRLLGNDFAITRDGTEIPYQGPMAKRANPGADSYVAIAPGASVEAKVELSLAYELTQPGRYRIAFRNELLDVADKQADVPRIMDQFRPMPVQCPAVETTITAP